MFAVFKVNFLILKIAVNINNVSDADFLFFHILIVINNLSRVVMLLSSHLV